MEVVKMEFDNEKIKENKKKALELEAKKEELGNLWATTLKSVLNDLERVELPSDVRKSLDFLIDLECEINSISEQIDDLIEEGIKLCVDDILDEFFHQKKENKDKSSRNGSQDDEPETERNCHD